MGKSSSVFDADIILTFLRFEPGIKNALDHDDWW
jgi:hypothetical protein